jgi:ATP-binding cassette subfamily B (MDR/TAP) protein 1
MTVAFVASWYLTLVTLAVSPLMMIAGMIQAEFNQGFSQGNDQAYKDSGGFVSEAVTNMRTVASFGREDVVINQYTEKL